MPILWVVPQARRIAGSGFAQPLPFCTQLGQRQGQAVTFP